MSAWPHTDCPGAGPLGEHELDAACWRKRSIVLTTDQVRDVDDTAGLCSTCGGENCPTPQACQQPENLSGFPLEPLLSRYEWLGPLLLALVGFLWLCADGYLAALPPIP